MDFKYVKNHRSELVRPCNDPHRVALPFIQLTESNDLFHVLLTRENSQPVKIIGALHCEEETQT